MCAGVGLTNPGEVGTGRTRTCVLVGGAWTADGGVAVACPLCMGVVLGPEARLTSCVCGVGLVGTDGVAFVCPALSFTRQYILYWYVPTGHRLTHS